MIGYQLSIINYSKYGLHFVGMSRVEPERTFSKTVCDLVLYKITLYFKKQLVRF